MPTIPLDSVVVSDTSFAAADPDEIVQSNHAYVNAFLDDDLTPDEIAPDALRSYYVDFFLTQVESDGFDCFTREGGWHPICARAIREGLKAMGAQRHLDVFEEASRHFEAGTLIELDSTFEEAARQEDLRVLHAAWLRSLPHLLVLPIKQMRSEANRRASEVPAQRIAQVRAADPRELRLIRELCVKAGHRYLHLYVDRFTDHARCFGVWHFITDQGHYRMIEQYGKALMQGGNETICEIDVPVGSAPDAKPDAGAHGGA